MPNRTIYIRQEDLKKWNSIKNKPEWLHLAINGTNVSQINNVIEEKSKIDNIIKSSVTLSKEGEELRRRMGI